MPVLSHCCRLLLIFISVFYMMSLILCLHSYHTMSLKGKDIGCGEWEGMVGGGGEGNVSEV